MKELSEEKIRENCPHCDPTSFALKHLLEETENFWLVCDVHPLRDGHILIIPKQHLSCVGEFGEALLREFEDLYIKFSNFLSKEYGSVSSFEHGKIGQTVFHSHIHLLPFKGKPQDIIPEGKIHLKTINNIKDLKDFFKKKGQYLFFSIKENAWVVNTKLGAPRFFRDRFAKALGNPKRGNWKQMQSDKQLMQKATTEIQSLTRNWKRYTSELDD